MFSGLRSRWPEMDHQDLALERLPLHLPCNAPPRPPPRGLFCTQIPGQDEGHQPGPGQVAQLVEAASRTQKGFGFDLRWRRVGEQPTSVSPSHPCFPLSLSPFPSLRLSLKSINRSSGEDQHNT